MTTASTERKLGTYSKPHIPTLTLWLQEERLKPISKHKAPRNLLHSSYTLYLKEKEFAVHSSTRGSRSAENQVFFNSWYKKKYFVLQLC